MRLVDIENEFVQKYITDNFDIYGYTTGIYLANKLRLTTQNPFVIEIRSNNCVIEKEYDMGAYRLLVMKPIIEITKNNYRLLQALDMLSEKESNRSYEKTLSILREYVVGEY